MAGLERVGRGRTQDQDWVGTGDVGLVGHCDSFSFHTARNEQLLESFGQRNDMIRNNFQSIILAALSRVDHREQMVK